MVVRALLNVPYDLATLPGAPGVGSRGSPNYAYLLAMITRRVIMARSPGVEPKSYHLIPLKVIN